MVKLAQQKNITTNQLVKLPQQKNNRKKKRSSYRNRKISQQIKIISLFQEDNIIGTNASLTYGPRLQR